MKTGSQGEGVNQINQYRKGLNENLINTKQKLELQVFESMKTGEKSEVIKEKKDNRLGKLKKTSRQ